MPATARATGQRKLLSVPQMLRLMHLEIDRAQQHRYPISCILTALDGFAGERDMSHRVAIMPQVFQQMKAVTFERKVQGLGFWTDKIILAIFPHVTPDQIAELGNALVERARKLERKDDPERTISVSAGIAHNQHSGDISLEGLIREAETGVTMARQSGGDACVQWIDVESELGALREELVRQVELASARYEKFASGADDLAKKRSRDFVDQIHKIFATEAQSEVAVRLQAQMIELALSHVEAWRDSSLSKELAESQHLIDQLERRVSKLTEMLDITESELKRVAAAKSIDLGIASIYRTVQGLTLEEDDYELKRELMKSIFEANLALQGGRASDD